MAPRQRPDGHGLLIGIVLGLLGYIPTLGEMGFVAFLSAVLLLAVNFAAVMVLLPRMVQI